MAQWIGIALTVAGFLITVAVLHGKYAVRLDNNETMIDKHMADLASHGQQIQVIEIKAAGALQQLADHIAEDRNSFERLEKMSQEIRADIKTLLSRTTNENLGK